MAKIWMILLVVMMGAGCARHHEPAVAYVLESSVPQPRDEEMRLVLEQLEVFGKIDRMELLDWGSTSVSGYFGLIGSKSEEFISYYVEGEKGQGVVHLDIENEGGMKIIRSMRVDWTDIYPEQRESVEIP